MNFVLELKKINLSHPVTSKQPPEFVFSSLIIYGNVLQACHFDQIKKTWYSRVHISSDTAFLKILKKPSIVQE